MSHVRQFMVQQQTHAFSQGSRQHSCENTPLSQARLQPGYTALDSMAPSAQNLQLAEKFFIKQTQQTMYILFTQSWLRVVAIGEVMRMPSSDRLSAPFSNIQDRVPVLDFRLASVQPQNGGLWIHH